MAKTITAAKLVAYAKAQLGKPYWYGTFGNTSTKSLYSSKKKQYPQQYKWACPDNQLGIKVHDCVGLIKGAIWCNGEPEAKPTYSSSQDVSANGMYDKCEKKGSIDKMPDVPGVLVFMDHHVGVYIGNGEVVEAKGHAYGVVKTKLKGRGWKHYGYCPWIEYPKASEKVNPAKTPEPTPSKTSGFKKFTGVVCTNSKNLNIRSTPKITTTNVVGSVPKGSTLPVIGESGDWYMVVVKGLTRYASKTYIKEQK